MRARLMLAVLMFAVACGADTTAPATNYVGVYTAARLNGTALPAAAYVRTDYTQLLVNGTLTVRADGTWQFDQLVRYRNPNGTTYDHDPAVSDRGTYTVDGDHLTFTDPQPGGAPFVATVSASGMTWTHGLLFTYDFATLAFNRQ